MSAKGVRRARSSVRIIAGLRTASLGRDAGDGFDLDLHSRHHQLVDPDQGAARAAVAEELLADRVDGGPVVDVGEVDDHLQHIGEGGPGRIEDGPDVLQGGPGLGSHVVAAHQVAVAVEGPAPGDEQQVAEAGGVGVVAERRVQPVDPDLFFLRHLVNSFSGPSRPGPWNLARSCYETAMTSADSGRAERLLAPTSGRAELPLTAAASGRQAVRASTAASGRRAELP